MKYLVINLLCVLLMLGSFGFVTAGEKKVSSPCWFVNKNDTYPFENENMQQFFPEFDDYKPSIDYLCIDYNTYLNSVMQFAIVPMIIEGLVFNPQFLSLVPFLISNMVHGLFHTHGLAYKFENRMKELGISDYCLQDSQEIKEYLLPIQKFKGKFNGICYCDQSLKILSKDHTNNFSGFGIEQDYKFIPIKVPESIKKNLNQKTSLTNRDYFYSAVLTALCIYCASSFYYKSFTAPLNVHTLLRIELAIWYNWYVLYKENKRYQAYLMDNMKNFYESFVIKVHNYELMLDTAHKHL